MRKISELAIRQALRGHVQHVRALNTHVGKVTIFATLGGALVFALGFGLFFEVHIPQVRADDVSTSVNVLNTPPDWTVDAQESPESSATNPTNSGSVVTWVGTATDSSGDNYFLLICKASTTPTALSNAPPTCGGGISNRWAVSATTTSGSQATVSTTTKETFPFQQENNDWTAWICDANISLPRCNAQYDVGTSNTASPFVVNHPPVFSAISNNGPVSPGGTITWSATAYDNDREGSTDTVRIFVCKANDFTGTACGSAGGWATSTLVTSNPSTSTVITIPTQDTLYSAFVFAIDNHNRTATSTFQGTNSTFTVNNVAPSVTAATISLEDTDHTGNLTLVTPASTSGPFYVKFTAVDNNSCQAVSGNEMTTTTINVYRSSITQLGCNSSGQYNTNNCYTASSTQFYSTTTTPYSGNLSCTQDVSSCSGSSDSDSTWTCTFPLWFNADPTDTATQFTSDNWLASVQITDNNWATSTLTESATGNDLSSFLAFDVTQTAIGYGDLQPGQFNDPLSTSTNLLAQGNVGLDENLYGDTMCTTWTGADTCDVGGANATRKIPVNNQKFASSTVSFASAFAYNLTSSSSPTSLGVHVLKTIATSSIQTKNTYWAINIPSSITVAGAYSGQNTITAVKSSSSFW